MGLCSGFSGNPLIIGYCKTGYLEQDKNNRTPVRGINISWVFLFLMFLYDQSPKVVESSNYSITEPNMWIFHFFTLDYLRGFHGMVENSCHWVFQFGSAPAV